MTQTSVASEEQAHKWIQKQIRVSPLFCCQNDSAGPLTDPLTDTVDVDVAYKPPAGDQEGGREWETGGKETLGF